MLPSLALFTPVSPQKTGLADHMETLLPHLAPHFRISIVTSGEYRPERRTLALCASLGIACMPVAEFMQAPQRYDMLVYQLGNDAQAHGYMYEALHKYPGVVLLHDLTLYHGILHDSLRRGRADEFVDEMQYAYGHQGRLMAEAILQGQKEAGDQHPLVERVLDDALALVGFNSFVSEWVARMSPGLMCTWIPLHMACPMGFPRHFDAQRFRRSLGLEHIPLVATVGLYNPNNRIELVLRAFKMLLNDCPDAVYLLVGQPPNRGQLEEEITTLGLDGHVRFTGWVSSVEFEQYLRIPDVAVQLRYPHAGGTSYNPIRLAAHGVPTIISRIPPMQDIPEQVMIAIEPGAPDEAEQVYESMRELLTDDGRREAMSARGRAFVEANHTPEIAAQRLVAFVHQALARRSALEARRERRYCPRALELGVQGLLVQQAGAALSGLGLRSSSAGWLAAIAEDIVAFSAPLDAAEAHL